MSFDVTIKCYLYSNPGNLLRASIDPVSVRVRTRVVGVTTASKALALAQVMAGGATIELLPPVVAHHRSVSSLEKLRRTTAKCRGGRRQS